MTSRYILVATAAFLDMDQETFETVDRPVGYIINAVVWDGNTETWNPPEGFIAVLDDIGAYEIGDTYTS